MKVLFARPSLGGRMETINITNELLREENVALQRDIGSLEESRSALQATLLDYELQLEKLQTQLQERDKTIALLTSEPPVQQVSAIQTKPPIVNEAEVLRCDCYSLSGIRHVNSFAGLSWQRLKKLSTKKGMQTVSGSREVAH